MENGVVRFIDTVPKYEIRDGIVHLLAGNAELCCASLRTFRAATARAVQCLAEHDAKRAEVVPMRKRGG